MTSHTDILAAYAVVSIATACAIIGGDSTPVSPGTIYRLVRAGHLAKAGKGKITTASIRAYLEHGQCRDGDGAGKAPAASTKPTAAYALLVETQAADWERRLRVGLRPGSPIPPRWCALREPLVGA